MSIHNFHIVNNLRINDRFGSWFSGFFDGEGSLIVEIPDKKKNPMSDQRIRIGQRSDDSQILYYIRNNLGVGNIPNNYPTQKGSPVTYYQVTDIEDLVKVIIPVFENYPLYSKKAKEYLIWKEEVLRKYSSIKNGIRRTKTAESIKNADIKLTEQAIAMLRIIRKYNRNTIGNEIKFKKWFLEYQVSSRQLTDFTKRFWIFPEKHY